jgi:nicotinate-nucleotide adenylyltransferase
MGRRVAPVTSQRWGILGGLFDPIHYAHLAMAEQVRVALDLAGVLFVPAGQPVHRDAPHASAEDRLRMIELAIADNPAFAASRVEIDRPAPSYMVDTLEAMRGHESSPSLVLIVSAETVALMPTTWSRVDRLLELAEVAVVRREGYSDIAPAWLAAHFPGKADRFHLLDTSRLGHSSTDIRARVAAGQPIRYLVPPAVESYIGEHRLYGRPA